jgi:hypothetical protein
LIVKCSHCKKLLSDTDFDSHECNLAFNGVKRIEVVYFRDDSYKNKKLMTGWGTDGITYTFEVVPRKPIPLLEPLSRRKVTDFRTDEDETEPPGLVYDPNMLGQAGAAAQASLANEFRNSHARNPHDAKKSGA